MDKVIRMLIISDLHAVNLDDVKKAESVKKDSKLHFQSGNADYANEFIHYAKSLGEDLDFLICCGDISNKCCTKSFQLGWEFLLEAERELGVKSLLTVPGNHDHQSRQDLQGVYCPKHHMQFTSPPFPTDNFDKNTQFWAWNWCHIAHEGCNVILLNSSAYHGYQDEYSHGRVSIEVVDQISEYIRSDKFISKELNLLVCHHHPEKMGYVDRDYDTQAMEGGTDLLLALDEIDKGHWLIVHGHKHYSDVSFSRGRGLCTPLIFSAGSFSANLYPVIEKRTSNQFYILEIDLSSTKEYGRLSGRFKTYEWRPKSRWGKSTAINLPAEGGFGGNINVNIAEQELNELLKNNGYLIEGELVEFNERIKFLTPSDFLVLENKMKNKGFEVTSVNNKIIEIGGGDE